MAKENIIYNLADYVTDEEYLAFVSSERPYTEEYKLVKSEGSFVLKAPSLVI
jgi:hypothetical protein